jgi:hypothetical protein
LFERIFNTDDVTKHSLNKITNVFRKQKEIAEEKRKVAKLEIQRQKEIMQEKERVIQAFIQVYNVSSSR